MSVVIATSAHAVTIFNTLDAPGVTQSGTRARIMAPGGVQNGAGGTVPYGGPLATSFVVTSTMTITQVTLRLSNNNGDSGTGSVMVYIVPDNSGMPSYTGTGLSLAFSGTLIGSIATSSLAVAIPSDPTITTSQVLTPGTYWLGAVADADSSTAGVQGGSAPSQVNTARWYMTSGFTQGTGLPGGTGVDFAQFTSGTAAPGVWSSTYSPAGGSTIDGTFMAKIVGTANTSEQETPEPATMAILGAGLMGMGLVRRYRRGAKTKG